MKQKVSILLFVAAAVLSCGKESVERGGNDDTGGDAAVGISFSTRIEATRGTMLGSASDLSIAGFNVWAIGHAGSWASTPTANKSDVLGGGTPVSSINGGSTWSYGTEVMWPVDKYVSFFAYGPTDAATVVSSAADGTPRASFDVDSAVADQTDLVIASPVMDQIGVTYSYGKPVNIRFKHALSRISFSGLLVDSDDDREIYVKKIVLDGLYDSGTALFADPAEWTPSGDPDASYTVAVASGELNNTRLTNAGPLLTTNAGYLFLMPQTLARTADDPTMEVTLDVDGSEVIYSSALFSPRSWEPGKSYNYQITVGKHDVQIIYIDNAINLTPWSGSIMFQIVPLTSDRSRDRGNIIEALGVLNAANTAAIAGHEYSYLGVYGVNDMNHDISIDLGALGLSNIRPGQFLMFDFKKTIRVWGENEGNNQPAQLSITNIDPNLWTLALAKQTINTSSYPKIDWTKAAAEGLTDTDLDGITGASLPKEFPLKESEYYQEGGETITTQTVPASAEISAKGSIILKRLP